MQAAVPVSPPGGYLVQVLHVVQLVRGGWPPGGGADLQVHWLLRGVAGGKVQQGCRMAGLPQAHRGVAEPVPLLHRSPVVSISRSMRFQSWAWTRLFCSRGLDSLCLVYITFMSAMIEVPQTCSTVSALTQARPSHRLCILQVCRLDLKAATLDA